MPGDPGERGGGRLAFAAALTAPGRPVPEGVVGPDGLPSQRRFNVYRNNVLVSLIEALGQVYPAIGRLLGEEYFRAVAGEFVREFPPVSPVLLEYGEGFPDFLERFPPLQSYPYLGDVARLEWGWLRAYHAADASPLASERLSALSQQDLESLKFQLHPATVIVSSDWPIVSIWEENSAVAGISGKTSGEPYAMLSDAPQTALITRPDIAVKLCRLTPSEACFLTGLASGAGFMQAAERAFEAAENFELGACLQKMLETGAFSEIIMT